MRIVEICVVFAREKVIIVQNVWKMQICIEMNALKFALMEQLMLEKTVRIAIKSVKRALAWWKIALVVRMGIIYMRILAWKLVLRIFL